MSEMSLSEFFKFVTLLGKSEFMPLIYLFVMFFMMNRFQANQQKEWREQLQEMRQKIRAKLKKNVKGITEKLTQHAQEVSTEIAKIEQQLRLSNTNANARFDQLLLSLVHNQNPPLLVRSRSVSLFK